MIVDLVVRVLEESAVLLALDVHAVHLLGQLVVRQIRRGRANLLHEFPARRAFGRWTATRAYFRPSATGYRSCLHGGIRWIGRTDRSAGHG